MMDTQTLVISKRKLKSTQLFVVAGTILVSLLISLLCVGLTIRYEVDTETADVKSIQYWKLDLPAEQDVWYEKAIEELKSMIVKRKQVGEVKNVIIFIAEGVNGDMLSRARFLKKDNIVERNNFIWDTFPHLGILKSSCSSAEKCDAFTLATALFGGVKTSKGLGGFDGRVSPRHCYETLSETFQIPSIFQQAKDVNLRTGFVSKRRVTGPLVAGLYAHSSDTTWECDGFIPDTLKSKCLDIASQLINSKEGRNINVIMGGGRQTLISKNLISNRSIIDESICYSLDKRNLLQDWLSYKLKENASFELIQTTKDLKALKSSALDYVLGIFANGDLSQSDPNLTNMVTKSLDILKRKDIGYLFVAETAVKTKKVEEFLQILWELDETIKETFNHSSFTSNDTVLLTIFLDLNPTEYALNDMLLYATGPKTNLFDGVHDATYLAQVISYYLKMGIFEPSKKFKK